MRCAPPCRPLTTFPPRGGCRSIVVPLPGALRTSSRPPSAASRSVIPWIPEPVRGGSRIEATSVVGHLEGEDAVLGSECERGARRLGVLRDVLECFETREVHGRLDLLGVATDAVREHLDGDDRPAGLRVESRREAFVREEGWIDPAGQVAEVVERGRRIALQVRHHLVGASRIAVDHRVCQIAASPGERPAAAAHHRGCPAPTSSHARPAPRRSAGVTPEGPRSAGRCEGRARPAPPCRARASPSSGSSGRQAWARR